MSILGEIFFRTGCQFGVPGGTYPPKKYSSAPPPPPRGTHALICKLQREIKWEMNTSVLESAAEKNEMEVVSTKTMFVSELCPLISQCFILCGLSRISLFDVTRLLLSSRFSLLVINFLKILINARLLLSSLPRSRLSKKRRVAWHFIIIIIRFYYCND